MFWCPLVGAESDSCGRNGRWKGLIFRHNRVHVQTQGTSLRKSSPRGVYPAHFPARQGKNVPRPISPAHFTLDVNGYPVVSLNDQGAPCCVVCTYPIIAAWDGGGELGGTLSGFLFLLSFSCSAAYERDRPSWKVAFSG